MRNTKYCGSDPIRFGLGIVYAVIAVIENRHVTTYSSTTVIAAPT